MASACITEIGMTPESFSDLPCSTHGWLRPRISFSRVTIDEKTKEEKEQCSSEKVQEQSVTQERLVRAKTSDVELSEKDLIDFEFRLEDPVAMLTADELFLDGKLVPFQISTIPQLPELKTANEVKTFEIEEKQGRAVETSGSEPYVMSPKAPSCISWRELLRLRRNQSPKPESKIAGSVSLAKNPKFLKHFLQKSSKTSLAESSLNLPLLGDCEEDSVLFSSRHSLSLPSSSDHDNEELPRLSLDSNRQSTNEPQSAVGSLPKLRVSKHRQTAEDSKSSFSENSTARIGRSQHRSSNPGKTSERSLSVDSPRMNSSGKVIFQNLGRSSSSPSSFNGGAKNNKHRPTDRNYSTNLFTPVLNVPVCSIRGSSKSGGSVFGLGQLFPPQKKDPVRTQTKNKVEKKLKEVIHTEIL